MATHARRRPFPLALLAISGSALLAASGAPAQLTEPFPDIFEMPDLLAAGGDLGFRINGYLEEHRLGYALASAGDINNDGFDDVLVGMYDAPAGIANVYVVFGSADGPPAANISITELDGTNGFAIPGDLLWSYEHTNLAGVGDINNDGIDDIAIGEPLGNGFFPNAGRTIVIYGDADIGASGTFDIDTIDGTNGFTVRGYISGARFGYSVAPAGDVNGDGAVDLVIGAPRAFGAFPGAGQAYVIFGGSNVAPSGDINLFLLNPSQGFAIDGKELRAASGTTVCSAGDINADGFDDVLIGAVGAGEQDGVYDMGAAYVVFGGPAVGASGAISLADLDGTNGFEMRGAYEDNSLGYSVAPAGDINNDGYDDMVVGTRDDWGSIDDVRQHNLDTFIVFGGPSVGVDIGAGGVLDPLSLDGTNGFVLDNPLQTNHRTGYAVAPTGDVNNDGIHDLLVGSFFWNSAYVVFGGDNLGASGMLLTSDIQGDAGFAMQGIDYNIQWHLAFLGQTLAGGGDINGDGIDDMIIGSPAGLPTGVFRSGEVFVVYGRDLSPPCLADTNNDGVLGPADFNAWVLAFNSQAPECDQNSDGLCDPSDFNAWVVNMNAGC